MVNLCLLVCAGYASYVKNRPRDVLYKAASVATDLPLGETGCLFLERTLGTWGVT